MKTSGSICFGFLWALSLSCLCCFPSSAQVVQQSDYREKTQSLSQGIHATLDELKEQQVLLQTQLQTVETDLKLSQGRVRELETELKDLTTSSQNMNEKLSDYATKSILLEHSLSRWRAMALTELLALIVIILLWLNKKFKWLKFFI